jgi:hypothetical protein
MKITLLIVPVIGVLLGAIPITTIFAQTTCSDGSQPHSNRNCPSQQQQQLQQQQLQQQQQRQQPGQSITDRICSALHAKDVDVLALLLAESHVITVGASTAAILSIAATYC